MKSSGLKLTSILSALALMSGLLMMQPAAHAADMLGDQVDEYTQVEFGTGWYIRGDIGLGSTSVSDGDFGTPFSGSIAGGSKFSEGFRLEAAFNHFSNLDYNFPANVATCTDPTTGGTRGCIASLSASTLMANAYLDFGKFAGFTPYAGVGVGAAYMSGNSFTYAANAMLGVSYDLSRDLKLDFGYRYTHFGDSGVSQGLLDQSYASYPSNITTRDLTADSFGMHEIRIGLRYEIW